MLDNGKHQKNASSFNFEMQGIEGDTNNFESLTHIKTVTITVKDILITLITRDDCSER